MRRSFTCCKKIAHQDCWKRQFLITGKPPPLGGAKCEDVVVYLKKDRFTADDTASVHKKTQNDPTKDLACDLCHASLESKSEVLSDPAPENRKEHYLKNCPAVPGPPLKERPSRKEILERIASLSLVKKLGKDGVVTSDVKKPFVFSQRSERRNAAPRKGPPWPLKKPPE